jgi:hypothetical protein
MPRPVDYFPTMSLTVDETRLGKAATMREKELGGILEFRFPGHRWLVNKFYNELRSPITGCTLQLDFYCPSLKLAFEADDPSHRSFPAFAAWNPLVNTREKFNRRQINDLAKRRDCVKHQVQLFIVEYGSDTKQTLKEQVDRHCHDIPRTVRFDPTPSNNILQFGTRSLPKYVRDDSEKESSPSVPSGAPHDGPTGPHNNDVVQHRPSYQQYQSETEYETHWGFWIVLLIILYLFFFPR